MTSKVRWVLVANASLARILRDLPATGLPDRPELILRAPHSRLRKIISGAPELSETLGIPVTRRGAALLAEDEGEFVRQIVALLLTHRRAGEFESLILVAGAPMLKLLRGAMPRSLAAVIDREIARNYVRLASRDLLDVIRREIDHLDGKIA